MKFQDPSEITCKVCGNKDLYPVDLLLEYEAKCSSCGKTLKESSDNMTRLVDELNETYELLQVILGVEKHFKKEYNDSSIENVVTIQDLITVTENTFSNWLMKKGLVRRKLLQYLNETYNVNITDFSISILDALKINVEKKHRS